MYDEVIVLDLYVAFKGAGNSSHKLVSNLGGENLFLTNSLTGLKRDIDNLQGDFDVIYMFGLDKTLKGNVRIETHAVQNHRVIFSRLNLDMLAVKLNKCGVRAELGNTPKQTLCNEAYWHMLHKYDGCVVFFHIPSIRYIEENFINAFRLILSRSIQ